MDKDNDYVFNTSATQDNQRFVLTLTHSAFILGSDELSEMNLKVNYFKDGIEFISNDNATSVSELKIMDVSGKVLFSNQFKTLTSDVRVNYNFEDDTIYVVKLITSQGASTQKIIFN